MKAAGVAVDIPKSPKRFQNPELVWESLYVRSLHEQFHKSMVCSRRLIKSKSVIGFPGSTVVSSPT